MMKPEDYPVIDAADARRKAVIGLESGYVGIGALCKYMLRILDAFDAMARVGFSLCATDVYSPDTDVLDIAAEVATPERTSWSASGIDGVDEQHPLAALLAAADTLKEPTDG